MMKKLIILILLFLFPATVFGANSFKTRFNPFTGKLDYITNMTSLEVGDLIATGTISGIVVDANRLENPDGQLTFYDNTSGVKTLAELAAGGGGESTAVGDTTTIDLIMTGTTITANGLYTAGDGLTLTGADFDFDGGASPGGELGGTWALPTIDDGLAVTNWTLTTPNIGVADATSVTATGTVTGQVVSATSALQLGSDYYTNLPSQVNINNGSFGITIDGGGSAISAGEKAQIVIPYSGTINKVTLLGYGTGTVTVDIWKDTYANFQPTAADTICGGTPPAISSGNKYQDSTLSGWTTAFNLGDIFKFNVSGTPTATGVVVILDTTKN